MHVAPKRKWSLNSDEEQLSKGYIKKQVENVSDRKIDDDFGISDMDNWTTWGQ